MRIKILVILVSIILIIPVVIPLFTSFVPGTADGFAHKFRLISFEKSIAEGNIRPRWLGDQALELGAPIFLYNYLFPYYVIAGIHQFTHSVNLSVQIYQAIMLICSFLCMYLVSSKRWGWKAGIVAATIYTWAPYHLLSVYLYEGWGEFTSFMWPPVILYLGFREKGLGDSQNGNIISYTLDPRRFTLLIICWSLFIFSHNVSVLMFVPVLLGLGLIEQEFHWKLWMQRNVLPFVMAVMITAFFWLPAVSTNSLTQYPQLIAKEMGMRGSYFKSLPTHLEVGYATLFAAQAQFWDFTIGIAIVVGVIFACIVLLTKSSRSPKFLKDNMYVFGLLIVFFIGMFLSNVASNSLWNISLLQFVVYPFRFLFISTFAGSLLAGWVARKHIALGICLIVFAGLAGRAYLKPYVSIFPYDEQYFYQTQTFSNPPGNKHNMGTEEFLPKWADRSYVESVEKEFITTGKLPEKVIPSDGKGKVVVEDIKEESLSALVDLTEPSMVAINTFYFPNWNATIDGNTTDISKDAHGRIVIRMPKGVHRLALRFGISDTEKIGMLVSVIGVVVLGVFLIRSVRLPKSPK
jgi:hypothetical protein